MLLKRLREMEINWLYVLLLGVPVAFLGPVLNLAPIVIFISACLALVPLAGILGQSTEMLSERTGPRIGGLLNATLGNAAELIITIAAIREGLFDLVRASLTGSIIGNLLLVLGASLLFGGLKNGTQRLNRARAGQHANMLLIALIALSIPSLFSSAIGPDTAPQVEVLSLGVAISMIAIYVLGTIYSFSSAGSTPLTRASAEHDDKPQHVWSVRHALIVMGLTVVVIAVLSELLVGAVQPILNEYKFISEFFLGIVLIPIIGNVAEHIVAVQVALKNQIELSVEIAVGSSLQIALFVAPVLVFISFFFGAPYLTLHFSIFEIAAVMAASVIAVLVSIDGETNWLEGTQLLVVYIILALAFFFLPA
jgi:Ca2+:H+ antiporter